VTPNLTGPLTLFSFLIRSGGEGAVTPEEKNVKNWGPNARSPELNPSEGKRNPVLHGGSNEGGFDSKGNSKT
jgi:hypothetical protein